MPIYHIRKPTPRRRGSQYYRDQRVQEAETYCGASPTEHDIRASWQAAAIGEYVPCKTCIEKRSRKDNQERPVAD